MHRSEVTTPQLDAALTNIETNIARLRRQRRNLLKCGHIVVELERNPDVWVTVRINVPMASDRPEVFATVHQPIAADPVVDLLAYLRLEIGEPLEEKRVLNGNALFFWSSRAFGCTLTLSIQPDTPDPF